MPASGRPGSKPPPPHRCGYPIVARNVPQFLSAMASRFETPGGLQEKVSGSSGATTPDSVGPRNASRGKCRSVRALSSSRLLQGPPDRPAAVPRTMNGVDARTPAPSGIRRMTVTGRKEVAYDEERRLRAGRRRSRCGYQDRVCEREEASRVEKRLQDQPCCVTKPDYDRHADPLRAVPALLARLARHRDEVGICRAWSWA